MKKSVLVLISAILGTAYLVYIVSYFFSNVANSEGTEQIGAGLAAALVAPHMFMLILAVLFNWIGYFANVKWSVLVGAILYSVSGFLFLLYVIFELPSIILSFVGYAKMGKPAKVVQPTNS
jgi:hypothetical protein